VLRFGRFVRKVPSGLHLKLPYPIERVVKVPIERQLKEEFGFRTRRPASRPTRPRTCPRSR
jgi:membrane protease subunit HflK